MKFNNLNHSKVEIGFNVNRELNASLDLRLISDKPEFSTKYCTLSSSTNQEIEECGLYYVAVKDSGRSFDSINFKEEFLPRVKDPKRKVAFLDRDGILIRDTEYPGLIKDVIFLPDVLPLLESLKKKGFEFVVVTNQSGIGRGKYTVADFIATTKYIEDHYSSKGIDILETFYCPYHKDAQVESFRRESYFRKPLPGMHLMATEKYDIDLYKSIMIGDRPSDKIQLAGLQSFTVGITDKNSEYKNFEELRIYLEGHLPE